MSLVNSLMPEKSETFSLPKVSVRNFKSVGLEEKYYKHLAKQKMLQDVSKKFNGKIIMNLIPTIGGKELGSLIFKFKDSFGSEDKFIDMIIFNDQNYINNKIEEFYKYTIL